MHGLLTINGVEPTPGSRVRQRADLVDVGIAISSLHGEIVIELLEVAARNVEDGVLFVPG